jgi:hypothetical protein
MISAFTGLMADQLVVSVIKMHPLRLQLFQGQLLIITTQRDNYYYDDDRRPYYYQTARPSSPSQILRA